MEQLPEKYTTVGKEAHVEFEEKRSLFIGHAKHVDSEEEALEFIKQLKKEYSDATHNCFAYLLKGGIVARYSDDGEPQGTAGMPMLETIRKSGVNDVCVVVTRYFGGILLGAGGLVRAYSKSTSLALEGAGIVVYENFTELEFDCSYSDYQKIQNELPRFGVKTDNTDFSDKVSLKVALKEGLTQDFINRISELSAGQSVPKVIGTRLDN